MRVKNVSRPLPRVAREVKPFLVENHYSNWCIAQSWMVGSWSMVPGDVSESFPNNMMWCSSELRFQGWARICSESQNEPFAREQIQLEISKLGTFMASTNHPWTGQFSKLHMNTALSRFPFSTITCFGHSHCWKTYNLLNYGTGSITNYVISGSH